MSERAELIFGRRMDERRVNVRRDPAPPSPHTVLLKGPQLETNTGGWGNRGQRKVIVPLPMQLKEKDVTCPRPPLTSCFREAFLGLC